MGNGPATGGKRDAKGMNTLDKGFMAGLQVTNGGAEGGHDDVGRSGLGG